MNDFLSRLLDILKVLLFVIVEGLIIVLPIYFDLSLYVGIVVSNILTFLLGIVAAPSFKRLFSDR